MSLSNWDGKSQARKRERRSADQRERRKIRFRDLPVIYSHFLIVSCVVLMSIVMLFISNHILLRTLTQKNLSEMQTRLETNCKFISDTFSEIYAIPSVIEESRYFEYLRGLKTDSLPNEYAAVLALLGRSVQIPSYLSSESDECLVYLRGVNSIFTRHRVFQFAEDCFDSYLHFETTDGAAILEELRGDASLRILPMQEVRIGRDAAERQMAVIVTPAGATVSVMCTYSEQTLLRHLEMELLPENTYLQLESTGGEIWEEYPATATEEIRQNSYELHADVPYLRAQVSMWIPKTYFSDLLQPSNTISWILIALTAVLGLLLGAFLAKLSTKPLRELVRQHSDNIPLQQHPNEIRYLGNMLDYSRSEAETMEKGLRSNLLIRAFSGSILSETDSRWLSGKLELGDAPFRVAIFHLTGGVNPAQVVNLIRGGMQGDAYCEPVNEGEIGVLFPDRPELLERLRTTVDRMAEYAADKRQHIHGGVSGPIERIDSFHIAVRQARVAMNRKTPVNIYTANAANPTAVSWLQHERLYQSVLSGEEESAAAIIREIAGEVRSGSSGREAFYNVMFVLRSAADELELALSAGDQSEYRQSQLPWENVERLTGVLHLLFEGMRQKQEQRKADIDATLLWYITENYADCSLCAASVAEHFGLSEKSIYARVRRASGSSFNEYVLNLRMKKASHLLCSTQYGIVAIAEQCGFSAESTFYRVFKKYYRTTPKQYRQMGGVLKKKPNPPESPDPD